MFRAAALGLSLLTLFVAPAPAQPVPAQPAPPQTAPPQTAPAAPAARQKAEQEIIYQGEATSILGRNVRDPEARLVGRIVDVLVDDSGQPRAAIIDFGGFMGVGDRHIAVAWRALHFAPGAGSGTITLDLTADQIKATPEYHRPAPSAAPPVVVAAPPHAAPPATPPSQAAVTPNQ